MMVSGRVWPTVSHSIVEVGRGLRIYIELTLSSSSPGLLTCPQLAFMHCSIMEWVLGLASNTSPPPPPGVMTPFFYTSLSPLALFPFGGKVWGDFRPHPPPNTKSPQAPQYCTLFPVLPIPPMLAWSDVRSLTLSLFPLPDSILWPLLVDATTCLLTYIWSPTYMLQLTDPRMSDYLRI